MSHLKDDPSREDIAKRLADGRQCPAALHGLLNCRSLWLGAWCRSHLQGGSPPQGRRKTCPYYIRWCPLNLPYIVEQVLRLPWGGVGWNSADADVCCVLIYVGAII